MSFPNETVEKLKSKVSLRLVDSFGAAIADLKFQVRTAQNKIIAKGATDAEGKIPPFVADLGALLTLHVQRFGTEEMKLVKTLVPWSEDFRFKIVSAKRKDKVLPQAHEGSPGPYQRKTYTVKERDTLSEIAVAHRTTAAALASLNGIEVNDIIRIGQVLKVPNDPDSQPAAASAEAPSAPQPAPPLATPAPEPPPPKNEDADSAETESSAHPDEDKIPASTPAVPPPSKDASAAASSAHPDEDGNPASTSAAPPPIKGGPAAAGSAHPDKDKIPASTPAVTPPSKDASAAATAGAAPEKAKTAPNTAPIKTTTQDSRGANGTPKTSVKPTCDQTGCIKKGDKGLIVEELNIRLMGFGNTISAPAGLDQFTSATEKAVSQFQRDYMGVTETGRACRAVLAALDEFAKKFPIVFNEFLCQCRSSKPSPSHPCTGFGLARSDSDSIGYKKDGKNVRGVERPGIHRALFWSVRAARFYMSTVGRPLGYRFWHVSSGYRCWERARQLKSYTTNHMGNAVDIQFASTSDGSKVAGEARMEAIRDKVFVPKLGANVNWDTPNCISIEPIRTIRNKDGKVKVSGTETWIHMDVREFAPAYLADRFYAKTADAAEGQAMLDMAKKEGRFALINCGGGSIPAGQPASASAPASAPAPKPTSRPQPPRPMPALPPALPPVVLPKDASRPDCGERPRKGPPIGEA